MPPSRPLKISHKNYGRQMQRFILHAPPPPPPPDVSTLPTSSSWQNVDFEFRDRLLQKISYLFIDSNALSLSLCMLIAEMMSLASLHVILASLCNAKKCGFIYIPNPVLEPTIIPRLKGTYRFNDLYGFHFVRWNTKSIQNPRRLK